VIRVRGLADRSRAELAVLVREYLLAGHLVDRAGMPHVVRPHGLEAMRDVAIDEWIGASSVYTRRMQKALGFGGDDVATIFKGMQFDIGAPHQFMDFRYHVYDGAHGEFWLNSCGALMDVEPLGDEFVVAMCHHIEDPTFDATACATNPRARMRPIHRPPRVPADRHPPCRWTVEIEPDAELLPEPEAALRIAQTRAAGVVIPQTDDSGDEPDGGGRRDYGGPLDPDLCFEDFARSTLLTVAQEVCLQGHLLTLSFLAAIEHRFGREAAIEIGGKQFVGVAGVAASRLHRALGLDASPDAIATVLELHPAFHPRAYVDVRVEHGDDLVVHLGPCEGLAEPSGCSWPAFLAQDHRALEAIVQAVEPRARCRQVPASGEEHAWQVVIGDTPAPEPREVTLTRFSTGADFVFRPPGRTAL